MKDKIINIEKFKSNKKSNLTNKDIFNLILIYKSMEGTLVSFNLNVLLESLEKYKSLERFSSIYQDLKFVNDNGKERFDIEDILVENIERKIVLMNGNEIVILSDNEYFEMLKKQYSREVLSEFGRLMYFINNDLKYGIGNWELVSEDEYIKDDNYLSFVTGEFIGKSKSKKAIKKRLIENTKNIYE